MAGHDEIMTRLNGVFCDVFDDESIKIFDAMTANDLDEWDSLSHITLVLAVEREFHVKLKAAEVGGLENVGEMIKLLMERASDRAPSSR
jgi:acyl carrier protein